VGERLHNLLPGACPTGPPFVAHRQSEWEHEERAGLTGLGATQAVSMHGWEEINSYARKISDMRSGVQTRRAFRRTVP
jgi:hypothetical protein